jgi:hypothetical protein
MCCCVLSIIVRSYVLTEKRVFCVDDKPVAEDEVMGCSRVIGGGAGP